MNTLKLKSKMVEKEITSTLMAKEMNMARSTLWRKISNGSFTVGEVEKMISLLQLNSDEVIDIFFPNYRINATKGGYMKVSQITKEYVGSRKESLKRGYKQDENDDFPEVFGRIIERRKNENQNNGKAIGNE